MQLVSANTATNAGAAVVTLDSGTATVTWTADDGNELSETDNGALVNGLAYKNTDDAPQFPTTSSYHHFNES